MIKSTGLVIFLLFAVFSANGEGIKNLLKDRFDVDSIHVMTPTGHYSEVYEVFINQEINHNVKKSDRFIQRMFIGHYDVDAPTVIQTAGYSANWRPNELAKIIQANLVIVEYRFYGKSVPETLPWEYLNNDQAAQDLHYIRKTLGKIYKGKWVSTGISKGGTTTMMYKARFPKDVRVAVPYVGPMSFGQEDKRMDEHIKSIGTAECWSAIKQIQIEALKRSKDIIPMVRELAVKNNWSYTNISIEKAHEYAILELSFSFWQFGHSCEKIPNPASSDSKAIFEYIRNKVGYDFYNDATYEFYKPAFYQFFTENGYYGFIKEHLQDFLEYEKNPSNLVFTPNVEIVYDAAFMKNVKKRLDKKGKRMIYIQGSLDPWGACAYRPKPKHDAILVMKEGGDHSTRIKSLNALDQVIIYEKLKKWLKLDNVKPL